MPILYVLSGPDLGRSQEVAEGAVMGRGADCEVVLRAASISRRHAQLEQEDGRWFIVDLDSRNGLFLEDERCSRLELWDGAVFRLGDLELRFREAMPEAAEPLHQVAVPAAPELELAGPAPDLVGGVEIELENEEALDAVPPSIAAPSGSPPVSRGRVTGSELPQRPTRAAEERRASAMERAGIRAAASGASTARTASSSGVQDAGRPVLKYSHEVERSGFFAADLGQYPAWVRMAAGLLAVAFFAGVFWLAFEGTSSLK